jgi:prefoldin subunit 5
MTDIYHQYNQQSDSNTASPLGSSQQTPRAEEQRLTSQVRQLQSQVELLNRELAKTRARLRDLESSMESIVSTLRRDRG